MFYVFVVVVVVAFDFAFQPAGRLRPTAEKSYAAWAPTYCTHTHTHTHPYERSYFTCATLNWSAVVAVVAGAQCVGGDAPKPGSEFKWKNNPIYGIRKQIKILGVDSILFRQKYVLVCVCACLCRTNSQMLPLHSKCL